MNFSADEFKPNNSSWYTQMFKEKNLSNKYIVSRKLSRKMKEIYGLSRETNAK